MDYATSVLTPIAAMAVVFLLAQFVVGFTLVYRRNNLAAGASLALFAGSLYLWGWLGFAGFTIGTLVGAWRWVASIRRANAELERKPVPVSISDERRNTLPAY